MADEMFHGDSQGKIGKQIVLPLSRAVEISLKSLRIRFWRSMITVSSIILAIAFLSSILVGTTMTQALKEKPERIVKRLSSRYEKARQLKAANDLLAAAENEELRRKIARLEEELGLSASEVADKLPAMKAELDRERRTYETLKLALGEGLAEQEKQGEEKTGFFAGFQAKDYWLVSLALLVCFVGIVNAMLMSVTERFREIGTMKCLGALDSFIVKLFVLESVFQGSIGTFFGIVIGTVLSIVLAWSRYGGLTFRFFPVANVLLCILVAQAAGTLLTVAAAVFPARAAARMQPVEALRVDQ